MTPIALQISLFFFLDDALSAQCHFGIFGIDIDDKNLHGASRHEGFGMIVPLVCPFQNWEPGRYAISDLNEDPEWQYFFYDAVDHFTGNWIGDFPGFGLWLYRKRYFFDCWSTAMT